VKAMRDAVDIPVTVKHRIGLDYEEGYGPVRDFVGTLREAGCDVFIAHARNAVLKGLSPKENRDIPPLRYDVVRRLKQDFPEATFVLNGGLATVETSMAALAPELDAPALDGVMIGREAWHRPRILAELAAQLWPDDALPSDDEIVARMADYAAREVARGTPLRCVVKPMPAWAVASRARGAGASCCRMRAGWRRPMPASSPKPGPMSPIARHAYPRSRSHHAHGAAAPVQALTLTLAAWCAMPASRHDRHGATALGLSPPRATDPRRPRQGAPAFSVSVGQSRM